MKIPYLHDFCCLANKSKLKLGCCTGPRKRPPQQRCFQLQTSSFQASKIVESQRGRQEYSRSNAESLRCCKGLHPFQECLAETFAGRADSYLVFFFNLSLAWLTAWQTGKAICKSTSLSVAYIWWTCVPVAINTGLPAKAPAIWRTLCCDSWLRLQSPGGRVAATLSARLRSSVRLARWRVRHWYPVCASVTFKPQWYPH